MNRRTFLGTATVGAVSPSPLFGTLIAHQDSGNRELIVHTVHEALRTGSPLLIYSGLQAAPVTEPLLVGASGGEPVVEIWNDWNDHDLRRVFGAFTMGTAEQAIGSYRIFDTPDIAYAVHQPVIDEIEEGYFPVGGVRASRMVAGSLAFASLRLWNVIIDGIGEDEEQVSDVMLGLVKHLGRSIGAID